MRTMFLSYWIFILVVFVVYFSIGFADR